MTVHTRVGPQKHTWQSNCNRKGRVWASWLLNSFRSWSWFGPALTSERGEAGKNAQKKRMAWSRFIGEFPFLWLEIEMEDANLLRFKESGVDRSGGRSGPVRPTRRDVRRV